MHVWVSWMVTGVWVVSVVVLLVGMGSLLLSIMTHTNLLLGVLIKIELLMLLLLSSMAMSLGMSAMVNNSCVMVWSVVGASVGLGMLSSMSRSGSMGGVGSGMCVC